MPYRSLYIHIPFCAVKCDYCAFYSLEKADSALKRRYLDRLNEELREKHESCDPLETLFIGGGTPTWFSPDELHELMRSIAEYYRLAADYEFTVEGNPSSITEEKIAILQAGGVNRFSIGVQSFSPRIRDLIGRRGNVERIPLALEALKSQKVTNFNCDLIYGVPGQTMAEWEQDLITIATFNPPHVSTYSLMIEAGTPLAERGMTEGDDDMVAAMWETAGDIMGKSCALQRYEVSNFSRGASFACRHNLEIWRGKAFMGVGPAACYFDGETRWTNPEDITLWLNGHAPEKDYLPREQRAAEILGTGLRTTTGWEQSHFQQVTGFDYFELRAESLTSLIDQGILIYSDGRLYIAAMNLIFADYVARELL